MDKTETLKKVLKLGQLDSKRTIAIIRYGDRGKEASDFNILVVVIDSEEKTRPRFLGDNFDIFVIQEKDLRLGLHFCDPALTEPILTGLTIFGDEGAPPWLQKLKASCMKGSLADAKLSLGYLESLRREVRRKRPSLKTVRCCREKSRKEYENAQAFLKSGKEKKGLLSLISLSWAWSYLCFSRHYRKNRKVVTLSQLLKVRREKGLSRVFFLVKDFKKNRSEPAQEIVAREIASFEKKSRFKSSS